MLEKKRGVIVNVSSYLAWIVEYSLAAVYSATKSFSISFSDCLCKEYANQSIIVQCTVPLAVVTPMTFTMDIGHPTFWTPDPMTYARAAVATIGIKRLTNGCFSHELQGVCLDNLMPKFVLDLIFDYTMKKLRQNGLKLLQTEKHKHD